MYADDRRMALRCSAGHNRKARTVTKTGEHTEQTPHVASDGMNEPTTPAATLDIAKADVLDDDFEWPDPGTPHALMNPHWLLQAAIQAGAGDRLEHRHQQLSCQAQLRIPLVDHQFEVTRVRGEQRRPVDRIVYPGHTQVGRFRGCQ